ncbi:MAG: VWA domain-containing protein [Planctomycetaceae bacterium]|jgi:hypothetical protein|nr:VWA domain-containing protein [Planctomycetaceae bacterium]
MFRLARIQENSDWLLPVLIVILLVAYFFRRYRIDAVELKVWQQIILFMLRFAVIFGLLVYYLHPQWEYLVGNSRVAVLIDSSASMGNHDILATANEKIVSEETVNEESVNEKTADEKTADEKNTDEKKENENHEDKIVTGPTRLDAVVDWIERSQLLEQLEKKHNVTLYSFDAVLQQKNQEQNFSNLLNNLKPNGEETAIGDALFEILQRERGQPLAGIIIVSDGGQNAGRDIDTPLETAQRLKIPVYSIGVGQTQQPLNFRVGNIDAPERAFPNDPFTVKVPIEMIGGENNNETDKNIENIETVANNIDPINNVQNNSDNEKNTGKIKIIPVELWTQPITSEGISDASTNVSTKIGEKEIQISQNKTVETIFDVRIAEPGSVRLTVKILPPDHDHLSADNQQQTDIEIVDRKDRVLLFASAPSRDYQFLCSQINRDKSMLVDVYLSWAQTGISQNADKILERFPSTRTEMAEYNIVVAFDPNWRELSDEQIEVLEFWVSRQGGGLIIVAGSIHQADTITGWVTEMGMDKIRALYPVEFWAKQSAFEHRYHADEQVWALKFSRAGEESEFLKPMDNPVESRTFWNEFPGFYGFFSVKGVKPAATLLAASGSPETMGRAETGALIVEQFYGAGRVLYFGSGELWRLRRSDEKAYEQIATKMLRYVSQGRLQRESDRGSLATDKQRYSLGSIAQLHITANDAQLNPITNSTVPVDVLSPSGTLRTVQGIIDPNMPGAYQTHLPLTEEGTWSIRFTIPGTEEQITRTVQVRMSDLEREFPNRNEQILTKLATKSNGVYFRAPTDALPIIKESTLYGNINFFKETNAQSYTGQPITELLKIRSQRAVPDTAAEEKMLRWFLLIICSVLMTEWTLRRLMKLV